MSDNKIATLLALSLRSVLPLAEDQAAYLLAKAEEEATTPEGAEAVAGLTVGYSQIISRGEQALERYSALRPEFESQPVDAMDGDFEITFDDNETEESAS